MKIPDPAFPVRGLHVEGGGEISSPGMALRDYFAAAALQSFMANKIWCKSVSALAYKSGMTFKEYLSQEAYHVADAMLEARK